MKLESLWKKLNPKGHPSDARTAPTAPMKPDDTPGNWEIVHYLETEVPDQAFVDALGQVKERELRRALKGRSRAVLHGRDPPRGMSKDADDRDYVMVEPEEAKDQVMPTPPSGSVTDDLLGKAIRLVLAIVMLSTSSGNYLITQGAPPVAKKSRSDHEVMIAALD